MLWFIFVISVHFWSLEFPFLSLCVESTNIIQIGSDIVKNEFRFCAKWPSTALWFFFFFSNFIIENKVLDVEWFVRRPSNRCCCCFLSREFTHCVYTDVKISKYIVIVSLNGNTFCTHKSLSIAIKNDLFHVYMVNISGKNQRCFFSSSHKYLYLN